MGKSEQHGGNSKVCMEVQYNETYSWYAILGDFILQKNICALRKEWIKLERIAIVEIILLNSFYHYISCNAEGTKVQKYGGKTALFRKLFREKI